MHYRIFTIIIALTMSVGCMSTQQVETEDPGPSKKLRVWNIDLNQTWGEVGRPYAGKITVVDNYIDRAEYSISNLPPGLKFDEKSATISGTPKETGFYIVNVAVRKKIDDQPLRAVQPEDRWWVEDFELRIYSKLEP